MAAQEMKQFFTRSLTLVPHSLLLNRTETLATQAMTLIVYKLFHTHTHTHIYIYIYIYICMYVCMIEFNF